MWKPEHWGCADRCGLLYPNDLTDAEWANACTDVPAKAGRDVRPRDVNVREVLNVIF